MKNRSVVVVLLLLVGNIFADKPLNHGARQQKLKPLAVDFGTKALDAVDVEAFSGLQASFGAVKDAGLQPFIGAIMGEGLSSGRNEELIHNFILSQDCLDYMTSTGFCFSVPHTDFEIVVNWDFMASGDSTFEIMMPLPTLTVNIRRKVHNSDASSKDANFITGLGKALLQNELEKMREKGVGDLEILKRLGVTPILKPRMLFFIKLGMLVRHTVINKDMKFFVEELARLVFRLVLSGDISVDGHAGTLSSLLPAQFVKYLQATVPQLLPLADGLFVTTKKLLTTAKDDYSKTTKTSSYIFKDANAAAQFAVFAREVIDKADCFERIETFIVGNNMQCCDFELVKEEFGEDHPDSIVTKVVTYVDNFDALIDLGIISIDQLSLMPQAGEVVTFPKASGTVVCCCSDKAYFDELETFSTIAKIFGQAWNSFVEIIRKEISLGNSLDKEEVLLVDACDRKDLKFFFEKTSVGSERKAAFDAKLAAVTNPYDPQAKRDLLVVQIEKAEDELFELQENLEKQEKAQVALLAREQSVFVMDVLGRVNKKIQDLQRDIALLEQDIVRLKDEENLLSAQLDEKVFEVDTILHVLAAQKKTGKKLDVDLHRRLDHLQKELALKEARLPDVSFSLDDKLKMRKAVLDLYKEELKDVSSEIDFVKLQKPTVEELVLERQLNLYKEYLEQIIALMGRQQEKLIKLVDYREAAQKVNKFTPVREAEFKGLEEEVGCFLDANVAADICRVTRPKLSIAKRFMKELTHAVPGSVFATMRQEFVDALVSVLVRSPFLHTNKVLVQYLLNQFVPALQTEIFEKVSAKVGAQ